MKQLYQKIKEYYKDTSIDINVRLGTFFVNIGIIAAILGIIICLLSHVPVSGTIAVTLLTVIAPLITSITRHTNKSDKYGSIIAIIIIIMMPVVWLTTGAESGGSGVWFLFELFYINLFAKKNQILPYSFAGIFVIVLALIAEWFHPELFFHFTNRLDIFISKIGSCSVVTLVIMITIYVQRSLYLHEQDISKSTRTMTRSFLTSIANTIDTKDPYTGGHSRRVAECASALALNLGMTQGEADNIYFAGLLHDIGKIGVPDRILNKPGRLTNEEFAIIRKHPVYGSEILNNVSEIPHVRDGVLYHHEHYDGTGYPEGLKGEEIPFIARLIAVADAYDAMSTTRIYRKHLKRQEIINNMIKYSGTQFDPHILEVFVKMLTDGFTIDSTDEYNTNGIEQNMARKAEETMHHVINSDPVADARRGTTSVDNVDFTILYDYLCNLCHRYGGEMVLISVELDTARVKANGESVLDCMADLNKAITQNIRSTDLCTSNGTSAYLILLLNASNDNVDMIFNRISKDYYSLRGNTTPALGNNIVKVNANSSGVR